LRGKCAFRHHESDRAPLTKDIQGGREGYVGWAGGGGSIFQWFPQLGISLAYVPSRMAWYDAGNRKGADLQQAVADAVRKLKS